MVLIDNANTNGYVGSCLELPDRLLSKYQAGREKDHEFCAAVLRAGFVRTHELIERRAVMEMGKGDRQRIAARIRLDSLSWTNVLRVK